MRKEMMIIDMSWTHNQEVRAAFMIISFILFYFSPYSMRNKILHVKNEGRSIFRWVHLAII